MNSPALMTFNLQFVIKKLSKALQKNYLYNQDKYRYAKSMTSSYLSWSFSENIISHAYLFYNKPFKMKRSLKRISVFLRKHQKYCHFLLTTLHTTSIILVSTTIYLICLKLYEKFKRIDEIIEAAFLVNYDISNQNNQFIESSEDFLRGLTSKFVFYNEKLNYSTAKLIAEVCRKPNIESFIGKSLISLLEKDAIINGAKQLSSQALHKNLIYEEFLYEKFKKLVYNQMRKEELRTELMKTIVDFMKTEYAISVTGSQLGAALRNRDVVETFVNGCRDKVFEIMDNEDIKSLASLKLRNMNIF